MTHSQQIFSFQQAFLFFFSLSALTKKRVKRGELYFNLTLLTSHRFLFLFLSFTFGALFFRTGEEKKETETKKAKSSLFFIFPLTCLKNLKRMMMDDVKGLVDVDVDVAGGKEK